MTLAEELVSVWRQLLVEERASIEVEGRRYVPGRSRNRNLRFVEFSFGEHRIEGIEQNPETKSRWAALARDGQRIVQFRSRGRYLANVCEGVVNRYPAWTSLGLPP